MRLINIRDLLKNLFLSFSYTEDAPLSEAERLLAEIEEARQKMNYAWERLNYAAPEYVEIAVLELLVIETQFGLLNKRYRLLLGIRDESEMFVPSAQALSFSRLSRRQDPAFRGSLFKPTHETPSFDSRTSQLAAAAQSSCQYNGTWHTPNCSEVLNIDVMDALDAQ